MKKKFKLGVIGAGFMSTAIISGVIKAGVINPEEIIVSDLMQSSLDKISLLGVNTTLDNVDLAQNSEFILFAVKPQNLLSVIEQIKCVDCDKFISIMAGVKKQKIKDFFPKAKVARCMPNTPCSIGYGAIGLDLSDYQDENDIKFVCDILGATGKVVLIKEDKLNAVTGISGSSPAYFYLFLKGIIESGVEQGLSYEEAKNLAVSTMLGAAKMVEENPNKTLDELINAVCSKGGTTIQAVNFFNESGLSEITKKAIDACVKRSVELENL